ncbi:hypothetical protein [Emcibacter sp. SYSU 3D8]|uniref:hypothetical protein n=1 Tax=Emcibacter sp. SYSU 3D8 TaxID=3133969 RepID=UPI0031FE6096
MVGHGIRNRGMAIAAGIMLALIASSAQAQYINDPSMVEARGKKERAAQEAWVMLPPKMKICMDQALAMSQMSFATAIKQKLPPYDPRFATQMSRCQRLAGRDLQVNFPCTIEENGRPVDTMCDEVYAQLGGRQPVPLTYQQYVGADLHARKVDIIEMESPPARDARLGGQRPYR